MSIETGKNEMKTNEIATGEQKKNLCRKRESQSESKKVKCKFIFIICAVKRSLYEKCIVARNPFP